MMAINRYRLKSLSAKNNHQAQRVEKLLKNIDYLIGIFFFCFAISLITTGEIVIPSYVEEQFSNNYFEIKKINNREEW